MFPCVSFWFLSEMFISSYSAFLKKKSSWSVSLFIFFIEFNHLFSFVCFNSYQCIVNLILQNHPKSFHLCLVFFNHFGGGLSFCHLPFQNFILSFCHVSISCYTEVVTLLKSLFFFVIIYFLLSIPVLFSAFHLTHS